MMTSSARIRHVLLDDLSTLPTELFTRAQSFAPVFRGKLDGAFFDEEVLAFAAELEAFLRSCELSGFHCTREPSPGYFARKGLRTLDHSRHIAHVRELLAPRVSRAALEEFDTGCDRWRAEVEGRTRLSVNDRTGRVHFYMSRDGLKRGRPDAFFDRYGGEAAVWALPTTPTNEAQRECLDTLAAIGTPVVVEVRLQGLEFELGCPNDLAGELLFQANRTLVPELNEIDMGISVARMVRDVKPDEIVAVHPAFRLYPQWTPIGDSR